MSDTRGRPQGSDPRRGVRGVQDGGMRIIHRRVPARQRSDDPTVVGAAAVTGLAVVAFATTVFLGAVTELQLLSLAVAVLAFLVGLRRYFAATYPQVEAIEPREDLAVDTAPVAEIVPVSRRRLLRRALAGSGLLLGLGALIPITALGPTYVPPRSGWRSGVRLVDDRGQMLQPGDVPPGGVAVVWPEDGVRREHASVMLIRLSGEAQEPTRLDWVVEDSLVAYSKVCTHAGCPVGLFREVDNTLFCPCHQSAFDASRGAVPTFGPPGRPLPQLPLGVDDEGYLVALDDFQAPIGPPQG